MDNPLMPLTKFVLAVSAIVQLLLGLPAVFIPAGLASSFLALAPLPAGSMIVIQLFGIMYIANGLGAAYALRQNNWSDARTYLVIAGSYVALTFVLTVLAAVTPPGLPPIAWFDIVLMLIYLPLVFFIWRQESARTQSAQQQSIQR